jgi:hypothetical protein
MRKFTTLKEDLIKENIQVQREFEGEFDQALNNMENIREYLLELRKDHEKEPGNWGFVGSLGHVNDLLEQITEFLGHADEEVHREKEISSDNLWRTDGDPNTEI